MKILYNNELKKILGLLLKEYDYKSNEVQSLSRKFMCQKGI